MLKIKSKRTLCRQNKNSKKGPQTTLNIFGGKESSRNHCQEFPSPIMLPLRGGGGGPGWNGRGTSGVFSPGRATQGVKVIPLYPAKA
ncbi:hypothetical protein AVEN_190113-1 [Araneus ventricosus]|uniref:Uncharacterized protein n=1 Tax=Araneus ventricosus TaxID=182803 RepID=A0A4Y2JKP1_ARAVE|nr:hypothetical protein AVEN_190113-1 [Araneus ventricosus]